MPTENGEAMEINLGEVTGEELLVGGYEAIKHVFAAAIAQLTATDQAQAKAIFAALANDCDVERAKFILQMREASEIEGEVVDATVDPDGFEYPEVIE
jgi:hypothetical protein